MQRDHAGRRVVLSFAALLVLRSVAAWSQQCPADPNILLIVSDDQGWPYYGFMQQYIEKRLQLVQLLPKGSQPTPALRGWDDREILLPDDDRTPPPPSPPPTPTEPIKNFLTPALDSLATGGNYFPIGHASASRCMPALASLMTGRYVRDLTLVPPTTGQPTDPVLPELIPSNYLTMGGGKWQYLADLHLNTNLTVKRPFDRQIPTSDNWRTIIDRIDELKRFAGCSQCAKACNGGPNAGKFCTTSGQCGGGTCESGAGCMQTAQAFENTTRLDSQRQACLAQPTTSARPFFMIFAPYVPHLDYDADVYCPIDGTGNFDRGAAQCGTEPCPPTNPYCSYSAYCRKNPPWSCQFVDGTIRAIKQNLLDKNDTNGANFYGTGNGGNVKYLRFINVLDRLVDEILVFLKSTPAVLPAGCPSKTLFETTVILFLTDNSAGPLDGSKSNFSEHGYRTPIVLYNPIDGQLPPRILTQDPCAESPGCRPEFAQALDILPTIRDFARCGANPCTALSNPPYKGRTLRNPTLRTCSGGTGMFRQCVYDEQAAQQDLNPEDGTGVLVEAIDGTTLRYCKFFRCYGTQKNRIYDLRRDPYENDNVYSKGGYFCSDASRKTELLSVHDGFWGVNSTCPP